jgi:hypothetical protein
MAAKLGINHQILEVSDPVLYAQWWEAVSSWAQIIRVDAHMDALAWRVDPLTVYDNGFRPMDTFRALASRCAQKHIDIDFIRDGDPSSPNWQALGGDWSSYLTLNTWCQHRLSTEVWYSTNLWVNEAAKCLLGTQFKTRWQGPNESLDRGKDQWAYARMRNVYQTPLYARTWTSPALWGTTGQLMAELSTWMTMSTYDQALSAWSSGLIAVNLYPDFQTQSADETKAGYIQKLRLVADWARANGKRLVISEWGYAQYNIYDVNTRLQATKEFMRELLATDVVDSATLYWDTGQFHFSPDQLSQLRAAVTEV